MEDEVGIRKKTKKAGVLGGSWYCSMQPTAGDA